MMRGQKVKKYITLFLLFLQIFLVIAAKLNHLGGLGLSHKNEQQKREEEIVN